MDPSYRQRLLASPAGIHWRRLGVQHRHGIAVPLFSLRTHQSGGIGEYLDLIPLIDWCAQLGLSTIQLLPLNDSGPDPSPYSALSAYALNPLNLSLHSLPGSPLDYRGLMTLNACDRIDYPNLRTQKLAIIDDYVRQNGECIAQTEGFQSFLQSQDWLAPYAAFKAIRAEQGRRPWWEWPQALQNPTPKLLTHYQDAIVKQGMIQYLCDQQLCQVKLYAESLGILLMGDIPILLSPNSADVWWNRQQFDLSATVGAPPDQFSSEGQNWGFPLYRWDTLQVDDYRWWRRRLQHAARYFHLYRIDHIVGFFRLWKIPLGKSGHEGNFVPDRLQDAIAQGVQLLTMMLESAPMLPIGEDLGAVPPEVRHALSSLGICGTRVMRWERNWDGDKNFINVSQYPPESLCCVGTHDTEPLAAWWSDQPQESKLYAEQRGLDWEPVLSDRDRLLILRDCHQSSSLFHINPLQEYLALFPALVHANPNDERINIPGTTSSKNWTYRFKITVEQLKEHPGLSDCIRKILAP